MIIYAARHGETPFNKEDLICGATDLMLTERGHEQAERLADEAEKLPNLSALIVSPMIRAQQTAKHVSDRLHIPTVTDERLREWDYGSYEGKHRSAGGFLQAKLDFGKRMPDGGESLFQLSHRVYSALDDIILRYNDKNVLIVCHGGVCRVIESYFNDMTADDFAHFFMGNCEIRKYTVK